MGQFSEDFLAITHHFASFATSMIVHPNQPLVATPKSGSVTGMAFVDCGLDMGDRVLPIADLPGFNKVAKLFAAEEDYSVTVEDSMLRFEAGQFSQEYHLSDPALLKGVAPNPEKVQKYFDLTSEIEFELSAEDLSKFRNAISTNALTSIALSSVEGQIRLACVDVDLAGRESRNSSVFRFDTGQETDRNFRIGFDRKNFAMLPGDYTVKINKSNIRFVGKVVSYLLTVSTWSELD